MEQFEFVAQLYAMMRDKIIRDLKLVKGPGTAFAGRRYRGSLHITFSLPREYSVESFTNTIEKTTHQKRDPGIGAYDYGRREHSMIFYRFPGRRVSKQDCLVGITINR
jgi:hypothetical protein